MNEQSLAQEIAELIVGDSGIWIAFVGLVGGVIGALLTIGGNVFLHWVSNRKSRLLDDARSKLLRQMLQSSDWRKLSTMASVVGADIETTRRLLINIKARGSEKVREGDEEVWGLISKHPLDKIK